MKSKRQVTALFSLFMSVFLMIPESFTVFAKDITDFETDQYSISLGEGDEPTETAEAEIIMAEDELIIENADSEVLINETKETETADTCYSFFPVSEVSSWSAAENFCKALGGHLAIISSAEENSTIFALMKEAGYNNAYFGYTDFDEEGSWHWIDGYTSNYVNWAQSEPNSSNSNEDYAMFYSSYTDGTWNDGDFSAHTNGGDAAFICEFGDNDAKTVNVSPVWPEPGMKNVYCGYQDYENKGITIAMKVPADSKVESLVYNNDNLEIKSQNGYVDFNNSSDFDNHKFEYENGTLYIDITDSKEILEPGLQITVSIFENFIKYKNEPNKKTKPFSWTFTLTNVNPLTDTNCFGNNESSTGMENRVFKTGYGWEKKKILFSMANKHERDNILDAMYEKFEGICYGTAMTQALLLSNRIGIRELTDNAEITNYRELHPNEDYYFRDNLIYYYMLQKISQFSRDKVSFATLKKGDDAIQFFDRVAAKLKEGELVPLFIVFNKNDQHIVLLYSLKVELSGDYTIFYFDCNSLETSASFINISPSNNSFDFSRKVDKYNVENDYKEFNAFDLNIYDSKLKNLDYNTDPPEDSISYVRFRDQCTAIFGIDGFEYRNDPSCSGYQHMKLINSVALSNGSVSGGEYYYEIDNLTDEFSIKSDNEQIYLSIGKADNYVSVMTQNAESIDVNFKSEPEVVIHGNDYSFDVSMRMDEPADEYVNQRFEVKGSSTADVLIERNADDVYASSENVITEIETSKWDSEGINTEQLPDSSEVEMLLDTSFILDVHKLTMKPGEEYRISPLKLPTGCSTEDIVWTVNDDNVVEVDQDGTVRAVNAGAAFVTATLPNLNISKMVKITVRPWVSGIELNKNELVLEAGKTEQLSATVLPEDADNKNVIWTSSDSDYVTVDEKGNITAVKVTEDPVTVTAKTEERGFTADCQVTVVEPVNASTLKCGKGFRYLNVGENKQLNVIAEPEHASLVWQSDNESVLTVDSQGIVEAVSEGTATVTVSSGEKSLEFAITVIPYTIEEWIKDYEHTVDLDNKTVQLKHYDFDYHSDENLQVYNHAIVNGEEFNVCLDYGVWWCRDYNGDYDIRSIEFPDGIVFPKNCYLMFHNLRALTSLKLDNCSTSNTTKMDEMFKRCTALETLDLSSFDTSNVINMSNMFDDCRSLKSIDLSGFDTSHVNKMSAMFYECRALERLDLSHFNTSNVTDMGYMFAFCNSLKELNVSSFDTSKVTSMRAMFEDCNTLTELDLSNFDLSKVTDISYFLNGANDLSELNGPAVYGNNTITLPHDMYYLKDGIIMSTNTLSSYNGQSTYYVTDSSKLNSAESIVLNYSDLQMRPGGIVQLTASIEPAEEDQNVIWISSDELVVTVDSTGKVTGVSKGTAIVTAATSNGLTASCTVTVTDPIFINSRSAALEDKIQARIYVYVPDTELETTYITTTFNGTSKTEYAKTMETAVRSGRTCRLVTVDTFAKQMRDDIVVKVHEEDGTPKYLEYEGEDVTDGYVFHIEDYVKSVEEKATDEKLIDLVRKMNWYGLYAQKQFNYNPVEFEEPAVITNFNDAVLSDYAVQNTGTAEGIKYTSGSLQLDSDTGIKVNYTLTGTDTISDYTFTVDGTAVQPKLVSGKKYYVTYKGIPAKKLNEWHTVTVTDKAGNVLTTKYSGLTYTYSVVSNAGAPDTLKDLCRSIYLYWKAAYNYFPKSSN